jgi:hypothetical protein
VLLLLVLLQVLLKSLIIFKFKLPLYLHLKAM